MAIRLPLTTVLSVTNTGTSGATAYPFMIPQDTDNIVVKLYTGATFTGTSPTLDVYVQTTDDGGTSWYDCANLGTAVAAIAQVGAVFATIGVAGTGGRLGSVIGTAIPSATGSRVQTGLPLLSQYARVVVKYGGTQVANTGVQVRVYANSQSATA